MATHSRILAQKTLWIKEPVGLQPPAPHHSLWWNHRAGHDWALSIGHGSISVAWMVIRNTGSQFPSRTQPAGSQPVLTGLIPPHVLCFPGSSVSKESADNSEDPGSTPGLGRSPGEGHGNPLTPLFLPGEFHGQRSLAGYRPWVLKELDMTEWLKHIPCALCKHGNLRSTSLNIQKNLYLYTLD